ncbi:serine/threonine protein kinase [Endozoicomonas sp. OPT23]|uniref:serine/threonine protein kinase n=1 Tax=Endozoicomonas sp. OPT23 TaxID=2072845 RepID=UPI001891344A|nr:serine/threonine protein kinase [Endozoicomonas sp. OPT23]
MKRFFILLLIISGELQAYGFPISNPFLATIIGTPPAFRAVSEPTTIQEAIYGLAEDKQHKAPDIFWDVKTPKFKFAWQKNKSPLVVIIAGTGGRFDTSKVEALKKIFYQSGFHVLQLSSPTSYDFIVSSSVSHRTGLSTPDSIDLYRLMQQAIERVKSSRSIAISDYYLVGYSLGAMDAAFIGKQDKDERKVGFRRILMINPPVYLERAVSNLDKLLLADVPGVDDSTALFNHYFDGLADYFRHHKSIDLEASMLRYVEKNIVGSSREELALLIGMSFRFSVAAMLFTSNAMTLNGKLLPEGKRLKLGDSRTKYMESAMHCSFQCYVESVLLPAVREKKSDTTLQQLYTENSLTVLADWLRETRSIGVMHNADDLIIDQEGLNFLYDTFGRRARIYPRGGHVGNFLYKENVTDMLGFFKNGYFPDS